MPDAGGGDGGGLFASSRRELVWVLGTCVFFGIWVIGVSWSLGRSPAEDETVDLVFGLPAWVFWGVALPWFAATAFTIWFAMFRMKDHPLDAVAGEELEDGR